MSTLERAIALAARAHEGQIDKSGAPYILHPLRMMLRLETLEERIVATLHDVVEDCGVTFDHLRAEGFSDAIVAGVDAVTRRETETYEEFVLRSKDNLIGRRVKMADLEDNSDVRRLREITDRDRARLEKYKRAMEVLST
jgi:(p)ppGpp synthase/HD superfamily hydrolase